MARCKKTFEVESFKEYVNNQLIRTDEHATDAFKYALCIALEEVLHKTSNYKGYYDLYWHEIGFKEWWANGQTEVWEDKKNYIYGTPDSKYRGSKYSRMYY